MTMEVELHSRFPEVIELNVGGKSFATLLSTSRKEENSMLGAMFSGRHQILRDKKGRYFIDYDGDVFENILNYLRHGSIPAKEKALEVFECANYFGIESLVEHLKMNQHVLHRKTITDLKDKLDREQFGKLKQYAITYLNQYFDPAEDKYFALTSANTCPYYIERAGESYLHNGAVSDAYTLGLHIENVAWFKEEMQEELIRCLTHDLCELGFGTFGYYNINLQFDCGNCGRTTCHAILLRNSPWIRHDKTWKIS